ncbi:YdaU family protein [Herbaspirillum huttiense]|uniref:YdaU family protein n=1 Tax=Herbaspirillum huttiense TaxID=863372 RepID=UPI003B3AB518
MKYYSHHIGDFDRATRHLTRIERSVYRDLLDVYYDTEQQLTLDLQALCRKIIARSSEEVTAVEQVLNEFFTKTPTGWYHERCEEEIEEYRASTSQKSAAGKASAIKRAMKKQLAMGGCPTLDERDFNERSTDVERASNGESTNQEPLTNIHITTPLPPSGGKRASSRKLKISLQEFIDDCKQKGERPLRDYRPLWDYANGVGLDQDYVALAWAEFCRQFLPSGVHHDKRQKDWRQTFRNYIEKNYLKLWAIDKDGCYFLTTVGKQAQQFQDTRQQQTEEAA